MDKETIIEALKDKDTSYVIVGFFSCPINDEQNSGQSITHFANGNVNPVVAKLSLPEMKRQFSRLVERLEGDWTK